MYIQIYDFVFPPAVLVVVGVFCSFIYIYIYTSFSFLPQLCLKFLECCALFSFLLGIMFSSCRYMFSYIPQPCLLLLECSAYMFSFFSQPCLSLLECYALFSFPSVTCPFAFFQFLLLGQ